MKSDNQTLKTHVATTRRKEKSLAHRLETLKAINKIRDDSPYMLSNKEVAKRLNDAGYKTFCKKRFTHVQVKRCMEAVQ